MGFFSSIFGGGGSSNSTASTVNKVTVNPTTSIDIDFDLDALAKAIKDASILESNASAKTSESYANVEMKKLSVLVGLAQQEQEQELLIKKQEQQGLSGLLAQLEKVNKLLPLAIFGGGLYLFTKGKK